jgi:deoxyribodipyrimidine photo-lyase
VRELDKKAGVVWFRRDLRLDDNPAWADATATHDDVVALFVLEPRLLRASGLLRRNQLLGHLYALDEELQDLGAGLVVRHGPASGAVPAVVAEAGASAVYLNTDASSFSRERDDTVSQALTVPMYAHHGSTVHEPGAVLTKKKTLSQVFTPFFKTWRATPLTPWPTRGPGRPATLASEPIPAADGPVRHTSGSVGAWERVTSWLDCVDDYPDTRDLPAEAGTSDLSADLKFGTVAARTLVDVVGTQTAGREAFVRQLAWRDWWAHTLEQRPDLPNVALKTRYDDIEWRDDPESFERWCRGETGFPIVDAGMRQLTATGWMHNRVRMICASFLVKDLLIDWRKGERFFRHHLIDGDVAQNAGNWQWVAGTGPDAAPYFRVFNPTTQAKKFDPQGDYVRRWVPALAKLPATAIHDPNVADPNLLAAAGVVLGETYPSPIVDHGAARARALRAYKSAVG